MFIFFISVLIPIVASIQQCEDTPLWKDKSGNTCSYYFNTICLNGLYNRAYQNYAGSRFNFPELNCCQCGKMKFSGLSNINPATEPSLCTHKRENS